MLPDGEAADEEVVLGDEPGDGGHGVGVHFDAVRVPLP